MVKDTHADPDGDNRLIEIWKVPFETTEWGRSKGFIGVKGVSPDDGIGITSPDIEVRITEYGAGFSHSGHRHPEQIEIVIPITGRGVTEDQFGNQREFGPGHVLFIPANSYHANHNPFPEEFRCYIIKIPPSGTVAVDEVRG